MTDETLEEKISRMEAKVRETRTKTIKLESGSKVRAIAAKQLAWMEKDLVELKKQKNLKT